MGNRKKTVNVPFKKQEKDDGGKTAQTTKMFRFSDTIIYQDVILEN